MSASENSSSRRISIADPAKKMMPDAKTGIQNDLPTCRWLMVLRVFKLNTLRTAANAANTNSKIEINFDSNKDLRTVLS
jgi:hypothetical protein